jgi:hypothetical protein
MTEPERVWLTETSRELLTLHRHLIQITKKEYEKDRGTIASPFQLLNLLTTDFFFAWLRPLSELIVQIDELTDSKEPVDRERVRAIQRALVAHLGTEGEATTPFAKHYLEILADHPDLVMAHATLKQKINAFPTH